jgi:hypothetical protein
MGAARAAQHRVGRAVVGTDAYADLPAGPHQLVASETLFPGEFVPLDEPTARTMLAELQLAQ